MTAYLDDSFAYIPLFALVLVNIILFGLFIGVRIKYPARVSIFQFLSLLVFIAGSIFCLITPSFFIISFTALVQALFLLPHSFVLLARKDGSDEARSKKGAGLKQEHEAGSTDPERIFAGLDMSLLETGRDIMLHSADTFSDKAGISRLLDFINTSLIRHTNAEGGAILLVDDFEDLISVRALAGDFPPPYKLPADLPRKLVSVENNFRHAQFTFTDNIFGQVVTSGKAELITEALSDPRIYQNGQEDFLQCGSYLIIPMKIRDTVVGVATLARKKQSPLFTPEDLETVSILADFAGVAIKNMYSFQEVFEHADLKREALLAGNLQAALYIKKLPPVPLISIGNFFNMAEGVCSDYFDILPARKDRIAFILADVVGKGMTSLTIMIMLRAILRVIVNTTQTAATILGWANRGIAPESAIDHYASAALINYNPAAKTIQFSTAGTTPILYYSALEKTWKKLSTESEPLGVEKTSEYADHSMQLTSNDLIVLYTDGLIEAVDKDGNQYSAERLKKIIDENSTLKSKEITDIVKADLKKFTGSVQQHDDQSLLVLKAQ